MDEPEYIRIGDLDVPSALIPRIFFEECQLCGRSIPEDDDYCGHPMHLPYTCPLCSTVIFQGCPDHEIITMLGGMKKLKFQISYYNEHFRGCERH